MRHLVLIITSILVISGCNSSFSKKNENETSMPEISVKTIEVDEIVSEKVEYIIDECSYPEIEGLDDNEFQNKINNIFKNNLYSFIGYNPNSENKDENMDEEYIHPGTARCSFDALTDNGNILSIAQCFVVEGVGGCNNWSPSSVVTNIDLENKKVLNPIDLGLTSKDLSLINNRIVDFF